MKKCVNCGAPMNDDAVLCTVCGASVPVSRASGGKATKMEEPPKSDPIRPEQVVKYQTVYVQQPAPVPIAQPDGKSKAIISLVLGLVGLVLSVLAPMLDGIPAILALLICIVGIVFGVKARNRIPVGASGRSLATAGLTCSILGTVISGLMVLVIVCVVVGVFALCATTPSAYADFYAGLFALLG